ncbi:hypothetical protein Moror_8303 [Moniliophthora roreri MCA 2997]|uniref:F-box domain-containing protein n=1 Tax=Moniliophthora roreri (strain MCA 2997) TaxID=1381753 RepID=V2XKI6_MONRO|nr:hypothetical protein Moror_8303 [Moniliophthora roreri MCA 2997]
MVPGLPLELVQLILDKLYAIPGPKLADLDACALVCRAWIPKARSLAFRTISFGNPCGRVTEGPRDDSPESIRALNISQYPSSSDTSDSTDFHLDNLLIWRSSDGKRTIRTILPGLKQISFYSVKWGTVSELGRSMLHEGFQAVDNLELEAVEFQSYDGFTTLLHSFPRLTYLSMIACKGPSSEPVPSVRPPENLQYLWICTLQDVKLLHSLEPLPNWQGVAFARHTSASNDHEGVLEATAINQLMVQAVPTLWGFALRANHYSIWSDQYLDKLDLTRYPKLHFLDLAVMSSRLVDFLERLANSSPPSRRLRVLWLPDLCSIRGLDWKRLDSVLQHPYFSDLRALKCDFICRFTTEDVIRQPQALHYDIPDSDSGAEAELRCRLLEFTARLPMCQQRGILVAVVKYRYDKGPDNDWRTGGNTVPYRRTRRGKVIAALRRVVAFIRGIRMNG